MITDLPHFSAFSLEQTASAQLRGTYASTLTAGSGQLGVARCEPEADDAAMTAGLTQTAIWPVEAQPLTLTF